MKSLYVLILCVFMAACNSGGNSDEGLSYPADLTFDEKNLPPVSDADFTEAKTIAKNLSEASELSSQLLIEKDESSYDKQKRESKLSKFKPDTQQLVRDWTAACPVQHSKSGDDIKNGTPVAGKTYRTQNSMRVGNAPCPVTFTQNTESQFLVAKFQASPLAFALTLTGGGTFNGTIDNPQHQQRVGARKMNMSVRMNGRFDTEGEVRNSYLKGSGEAAIDSIVEGPIKMTFSQENLDLNNKEKTLTIYRLDKGGKIFTFTQFSADLDKNKAPVVRFFIGNRELTRNEVKEMGEFPFTPDDIGGTLNIRGMK